MYGRMNQKYSWMPRSQNLNFFCFVAAMIIWGSCQSGNNSAVQSIPAGAPEELADTFSGTEGLPSSLADTQLSAVLANFEREVWQKPNMVIGRMGDLSESTVADIGAGYGYFTFRMAQTAKKVIAIDIDSSALAVIDEKKNLLNPQIRDRIETRLCTPADPNLRTAETNLVVFVNTYIYLSERADYLRRLMEGVAPGGRLLVIDFKKKNLPFGPPEAYKLSPGQIEQELADAGWVDIRTDDTSLDFQYIVTAVRPEFQ